jgi:transcriptional activator of cad operon
MVRPEHGSFYVGGWRVSPGNDTVSRYGRRAHLEPPAMQVLVYLASRPGEVVSRSDLERALGHGGAVGNESLAGAVTELRKALGDDARNPRYIATVPKHGFRLMAPVSGEPVAPLAAATKPEPTARRRAVALSDRAKVTVLLLILAAIAALAWALLARLTLPAA